MHEITVILGENEYPLKIKENIVSEAKTFFTKMDADMDKGWQMSKSWVENPDQFQKCKIAVELLIETERCIRCPLEMLSMQQKQ